MSWLCGETPQHWGVRHPTLSRWLQRPWKATFLAGLGPQDIRWAFKIPLTLSPSAAYVYHTEAEVTAWSYLSSGCRFGGRQIEGAAGYQVLSGIFPAMGVVEASLEWEPLLNEDLRRVRGHRG